MLGSYGQPMYINQAQVAQFSCATHHCCPAKPTEPGTTSKRQYLCRPEAFPSAYWAWCRVHSLHFQEPTEGWEDGSAGKALADKPDSTPLIPQTHTVESRTRNNSSNLFSDAPSPNTYIQHVDKEKYNGSIKPIELC